MKWAFMPVSSPDQCGTWKRAVCRLLCPFLCGCHAHPKRVKMEDWHLRRAQRRWHWLPDVVLCLHVGSPCAASRSTEIFFRFHAFWVSLGHPRRSSCKCLLVSRQATASLTSTGFVYPQHNVRVGVGGTFPCESRVCPRISCVLQDVVCFVGI